MEAREAAAEKSHWQPPLTVIGTYSSSHTRNVPKMTAITGQGAHHERTIGTSKIFKYVVESLILRLFKHVELATLFVNNGTRLDLPRTFLHCGFVLGGGDFGVRFVNPFALWADHNGFAFAHRRNFGRLFATRLALGEGNDRQADHEAGTSRHCGSFGN
jgi:hypothetical protein